MEEIEEFINRKRRFIMLLNNAIENKGFRPSQDQQMIIDYICQQGKWGLEQMEKYEEFRRRFL